MAKDIQLYVKHPDVKRAVSAPPFATGQRRSSTPLRRHPSSIWAGSILASPVVAVVRCSDRVGGEAGLAVRDMGWHRGLVPMWYAGAACRALGVIYAMW